MDGDRALAVRRPEAVRPRVATAEDDDALAGRQDLSVYPVAGVHLVLLRQEVHGEVDAGELAAGQRQGSRRCCGPPQEGRVETAPGVVAPGGHGRPGPPSA